MSNLVQGGAAVTCRSMLYSCVTCRVKVVQPCHMQVKVVHCVMCMRVKAIHLSHMRVNIVVTFYGVKLV